MSVVIWHNPRCTKSRETLKYLEDHGHKPEVREYLVDVPSVAELKTVLEQLGFSSAREWIRTNEVDYKTLNLKGEDKDDKLLEAMAAHPKLIERPVVIANGKAALGRPPENVLGIL
ncbi:arsenate reductase (glutaredoxin) [Hyphobacterium sp.]|uniref:arsenate reductase (glutaredoxin) n=1 Tax=Hyphobacterium sp. TaxID=2004662 RepID=UPI00374860C4